MKPKSARAARPNCPTNIGAVIIFQAATTLRCALRWGYAMKN